VATFREGIDKVKAACDGVGRDISTLDITVFGSPGQWRTGEDIAALGKSGANRVTIWINAFETEESLKEMEALAKDLL
jgi:hypothetical protein